MSNDQAIQYTQPEIDPSTLTRAIEAFVNWKIAVRHSAATLSQNDYNDEREAWRILLQFPRNITMEAMRLVNSFEER